MRWPPGHNQNWAIVLAGGSGLRLAARARDAAGRAVPGAPVIAATEVPAP
jgi:hypothetical protein